MLTYLQQNGELLQNSLQDALAEKSRLEAEVAKVELQRGMKTRQLEEARLLIRQERMQKKLVDRRNKKLRQELDIYLNEMPMNYKKEVIAKLEARTAQLQNSLSSDSNVEVELTTDSSWSAATNSSSHRSPTMTEESDMEQAFSKRISSSTDSEQSVIRLYPDMLNALKMRQHTTKERCYFVGNRCVVCEKKFVCGRMGLTCEDCQAAVHERCRDQLVLPCIPNKKSNPRKMSSKSVADFCVADFRPQIPAFVIHSVLAIEKRGLNVKGLYVLPVYSHESTTRKQQLDNDNCVPNLDKLDISTVCELLKHFLSVCVRTPLISDAVYAEFERLPLAKKNSQEDIPKLYDAMLKASEAEKATLCFLFLHLKKVCESPECKVSVNSMSKTFAPILIANFDRNDAFNEKKKKYAVLQKMINQPQNYYECILKDLF